MEFALLQDIIVIFSLSIAVVFLFQKIGIPSIIGFLITGIFAGPFGLQLIKSHHEVELISEIGVILLLFIIGIEFSFKNLLKIKRSIFFGGALQVGLTIFAVAIIVNQIGFSFANAVFIGFLVALSSTAIVLKMLQERSELVSPHGRISLAILIFQDLVIVILILVTPFLGESSSITTESLPIMFGKIAGIAFFLVFSAKFIIPKALFYIARSRNKELFIISIAFFCLSIAWLTHAVGMSLALGAFLAGLIISESDYSHQVIGDFLPFRDLFASFFFVSIGMLIDFNFLFENVVLIFTLFILVILLKSVIVFLTSLILGLPLKTAVIAGLFLIQIGEFSFILSKIGIKYGLLSDKNYQIFLSVTVLTMSVTPFAIMFASKFADLVFKLPFPKRIKTGISMKNQLETEVMNDHLIVVGFGLNGRNVVKAAKVSNVPYIILEMNPETVKVEQQKGEFIVYGDASHEAVLRHVGIDKARVIVLAIHDAAATIRAVEVARDLNPDVYIIVRTRYVKEMESLYELGANEVIPEEYETSIELFVRTLNRYFVPEEDIEKFVSKIRADGYDMFRNLQINSTSDDIKNLVPNFQIRVLKVEKNSAIDGKSLLETNLRSKLDVNVLAVKKGDKMISNPGASDYFDENDILFVIGDDDKICDLKLLLKRLKY